jgi:hypothetical protein
MSMKIGVPDAQCGFVLAGRLARYGAEVVPDGEAFEVRLDAPSTRELPSVLTTIQTWIVEEDIERASVAIDGRPYTMS